MAATMKHPQSKWLGCTGPWQRTAGMVCGLKSGMSLPWFSTRQRPGTERGSCAAYNNTMRSTLHMELIVHKLIALGGAGVGHNVIMAYTMPSYAP